MLPGKTHRPNVQFSGSIKVVKIFTSIAFGENGLNRYNKPLNSSPLMHPLPEDVVSAWISPCDSSVQASSHIILYRHIAEIATDQRLKSPQACFFKY